ncbi:MAG: ferredoxin family protein [Verrucomicrobiales bacterium]|nr:ferredoxin family protein [Verrucomicrobiales bacterium]
MALTDSQVCVYLHEDDGQAPISATDRFQTISALLEKGYRVSFQPSAHPAIRKNDREVPAIVSGSGSMTSVDGTLVPTTGTPTMAQAALEAAESVRERSGAAKPGSWLPWFPVIDYDRCTNCMQCLSFCLFGVYGVDDRGKIQAQHQDNCKTHCPACSRVCPEAAIMFPKYKAGPINGDQVSDADLQREKMKIDISALLGGDVYALLRDRSERARSRFGKERDADKALVERQKCLTKLGEIMADVPAEVLSSLPSPEQIAKRAEEAKARAQKALSGA